MAIKISPQEPSALVQALADVGHTDSEPERYGADFLIETEEGRLAIQRKTLPDLIASLEDGRLALQMMLMTQVGHRVLILEGDIRFTPDGKLNMEGREQYTRLSIRNLLRSLAVVGGVVIERTSSIEDTEEAVREWERWFKKESHLALMLRPKPSGGEWGNEDDRAWARWFLQGFPGVGVTLAEAIFEHFGRIPLAWTATERELQGVAGIGPRKAKLLIRSLDVSPWKTEEA